MNDRFKFRFFDKKKQKMMYENSDFSDYCKEEWWGHEEQMALEALDVFDNPEHYILMQCTGLKDKNGKLIYEGDIIYSPSWWWGARFVHLDIGKCGPCKGDSVMSYILAKNIDNPSKGATYNFWNGSEVEVIGNIYENKELLQ